MACGAEQSRLWFVSWVKLFTILAFPVVFSIGCLPYPVMEPPESLDMEGRIFIGKQFARWEIKKVIAMDKNGYMLAETTPVSNGTDFIWSLPVVTEENSIGTFWVEMRNGADNITYYNEGSDERFISGGHYDLHVNQSYIPLINQNQLASIGKDAKYPSNGNYVLIRDITLSGVWDPLCINGASPFSGVFDGHRKTIKRLVFPDETTYQYVGLFAYVSGAELKNLNLEVTGESMRLSEANEQCFGVLAGFAENTAIDKITVNGHSRGLKIVKPGGGDFFVGGIAGKITGNSAITRSAMLFTIEVDAANAGAGYLGGIAGYAKLTDQVENTIKECYNRGSVILSNTDADTYAGGIVGCHENGLVAVSTIIQCYASGEVSASGGGLAGIVAAGGLLGGTGSTGSNTGELEISKSCALMVSVSASSTLSPNTSAGGLSGYGGSLSWSQDNFQLDTMTLKPSGVNQAVDGTPQNKAAFKETWFSASLEWDFSLTWQWDAQAGYPKFLWQ
ncbi:MAG: hypothetical protein LBB22_03900 [Treponema sp.]|nr:hypothetical protein [Treponema sp.]